MQTSGKNYKPEDDSNYDFRPVPHGGEFFGKDYNDVSMNESIMPKFKFSETALPAWAKEDKPSIKKNEPKGSGGDKKVQGRWAQRVDEGILIINWFLVY